MRQKRNFAALNQFAVVVENSSSSGLLGTWQAELEIVGGELFAVEKVHF